MPLDAWLLDPGVLQLASEAAARPWGSPMSRFSGHTCADLAAMDLDPRLSMDDVPDLTCSTLRCNPAMLREQKGLPATIQKPWFFLLREEIGVLKTMKGMPFC